MNNNILKIAEQVRKELIEIYDSPKDVCLEACKMLKKAFSENGIASQIIQGKFKIDEPCNYIDDNYEYNEEVNFEPLHYWIEINGCILDITADQFDDVVIYDEVEEITFGTYENLSRYIKVNEDWQ